MSYNDIVSPPMMKLEKGPYVAGESCFVFTSAIFCLDGQYVGSYIKFPRVSRRNNRRLSQCFVVSRCPGSLTAVIAAALSSYSGMGRLMVSPTADISFRIYIISRTVWNIPFSSASIVLHDVVGLVLDRQMIVEFRTRTTMPNVGRAACPAVLCSASANA